MQNKANWIPTKFIESGKTFKVTNDKKSVGVAYRFIGDIQARNYHKLIVEHARGLLLDLGCGYVPLYQMYRSKIIDNICADWPNTYHKNAFLDFQIDLNKSLPIKNDIFDTILLTDVLEHIAHPQILWKEMTRILKPDGKIIIGVPFFHLLHEEPYDYFRYTEFRLKLFCEENNLKVVTLFPYGASFEIMVDFIAKHISFSSLLSNLNLFFGRVISKSLLGKKIYSFTSSKYPLGYCLVAQK